MKEKKKALRDGTRLLHDGSYEPAAFGGHLNTPLFLDVAPVMPSMEEACRRFESAERGVTYMRKGHVNARVLEQKLAAMEGAEDALVFSSGMAATNCLLLDVVPRNFRIVSQQCVYGGTLGFLTKDLVDAGRHVWFVEHPLNHDEWWKAIHHDLTAAVWVEMPSNPRIDLVELDDIAAMCREQGVLLIVDNTFAPLYFPPLQHGADIVLRSCTKYENPGNTSMLGAIMGTRNVISKIRNGRYERLGAQANPLDCWLTEAGLRVLDIRMERHCGNALKVARFLASHRSVKSVNYPGLETSLHHALARKYMPKGCGAILSFEMNTERQAVNFVQSLELFSHVISLGDVRSIVTYPAKTTHSKAPAEMRAKMEISETLIRLSVGIEDPDDLIADLQQALKQ